MTQPTASSATPTRRHVVKGAMWAVPAIAVASQVPAFAASPLIQLTVTAKCRYTRNSSGMKGSVKLSAKYENKTNQAITVTPQQGTLIAGGTTRTGGFTYAGSPGGVTIPAGGSTTIELIWSDLFKTDVPVGDATMTVRTKVTGGGLNIIDTSSVAFNVPNIEC